MDLPPRPELFDFHGISMTHYFTSNWENVQKFQARPDDVFIASYPKAGNTWLCYILDLLFFGPTSMSHHERVPNLEITIPSRLTASRESEPLFLGTDHAESVKTSPRIMKTHLPVHLIPKSVWEKNCRIVYVARNAKDSVVSYYHFERMTVIFPEPGDWDSYLKRFMAGKMMFGSWYDHVNNWWKRKQSYSNVHFMFYEDLIENTGREIEKLSTFLGLSPSSEEMERIIDLVQFDKMKTNNNINLSGFPGMNFKVSSFIRKGKVGDWKNHFTVAQNEEFEEDYKIKMKNSTLKFPIKVLTENP
ncbi:cytosolic sulfotransferase 3-like [Takifugu flavidus]|uniref:cytosolic sulfotransferase 3-like n=1 Tax=Takifugu flavidus TaxID=433684 RepID=UPI0025445322|nr:cytosolic sulfotransferase 3-like [Takifugu flavidus]XP_056896916.1 cytosolic sulfotransferase 3-like [Takifugu flavidus]